MKLIKNLVKKINDLNSEGFELLFKETNLHSSSVIGLSNNFIKLINWAQITFDFLDRYDKNNLNKDLENCLNVTFYENPEILQEVLLNHNIFDSEQQVKALEILDTLLEDKKEEYVRLNDLISKQIAFKASHYINNISYQHILKLQDKDFKIHRYDDMKKHHLFVNLF